MSIIKFSTFLMALVLIGSLVGINLWAEPAEAVLIEGGLIAWGAGLLGILGLGGLISIPIIGTILSIIVGLVFVMGNAILVPSGILATGGLLGSAGGLLVILVTLVIGALAILVPIVLIVGIIFAIVAGVLIVGAIGGLIGFILTLLSPLIALAGGVALITLPIWGVPFILFLFSVGVFGFIIITALGLIAIPILLIGAFILQLFFGVPVFSILFSLLQVGGHLILIPLSLIKPMVNGISNFIQSIGKIETTEVIA